MSDVQETNSEIQGTNSEGNKEVKTSNTNEQNSFDATAILDKLEKQGAVLERLGNKPEEVNADGLKHLGNQTKELAESVKAFMTNMEKKSEGESKALSEIQSMKLEIAREKTILKHGLSEEDGDLLSKFNSVEEMDEFAERLSNRLKEASPKSQFNFGERKKVENVPSHISQIKIT